MLRQFLVGGGISLLNIAIHAMIMTIVVQVAQAAGARKKLRSPPTMIRLTPGRAAQELKTGKLRAPLFLMAVIIPTVSVLMVTHAIEVIVWASAYSIVDAAPSGANIVYFAFVNYTTLGYGDVVPVERWRLLGPITAMNGVLLFGWSTAVIFEVLRKALAHNDEVSGSGNAAS